MSAQEWDVLGAGAIGCLFASAMAPAGLVSSLISRNPVGAGLCTITVERDGRSLCENLNLSPANSDAPINNLLVTTKAYDVEEAITSVLHRLQPGSRILLLVNGMGFAERIARLAAACTLYCGTTTEGAYRKQPYWIRHAGRGITRIGSLEMDEEPVWFAPWRELELRCQWQPRMEAALWHKLAINCAINPLTALYRCLNGELASRPELSRQVETVCDEVAAVSEAAGYGKTARSIHAEARAVIRDTGGNRSSMLQDVLAGRRTEIEFITGHLVERGRQLGIAAPANRALLEKILLTHA